jgi:alpha-methylacyl-CoA racemase
MADPSGPLYGLTLLDLGGIGPAGRCVRVLADLGTRWIQVVAPAVAGRLTVPWHTYGAMRGVERLPIDLKHPQGRDVLLHIAAASDIVVEGFRPGVADRLGIGFDAMSKLNPQLIYCAATGYGQSGPYSGRAGHDLNYQAVSGALATARADAHGKPALPAMTFADSAAGGWAAAIRILAALQERTRTRRGQFIDASAAEGMLHLNAAAIDEYLATGEPPGPDRGLLTGGYACYDVYRTRDGGFLSVAAIEPKFFRALCVTLGREDLVNDQNDPKAQNRLRDALAAAFATRSREEWMKALGALDVCVAPVLSIEELPQDEHWRNTGVFIEYKHPDHGRQRQVRALDARRERGEAPMGAPVAPDNTLRDFGYSQSEIDALKQSGALG